MSPDYILFTQHGWADDNRAMLSLAKALVRDGIPIVAPRLNYAMTWLRIEPLILVIERQAQAMVNQYPQSPWRIIGHSMGGLIWLELLSRHPSWWQKVEFLTLVAAPVGGADLGRIIDPLQVGLGIAANLGKDRRPLAAALAAQINTLVLAGDLDQGSDGTITVESTKVPGAQFVSFKGLSHPMMRNHPAVVEAIQHFWQGRVLSRPLVSHPVIERLRAIPGMTDAHLRGFDKSRLMFNLKDGIAIRLWISPLGIDHVFVVSPAGDCLYSGYVGWLHRADLWRVLRTF
jgi:pimeloyl-ACP methyl ester carboxylesterase